MGMFVLTSMLCIYGNERRGTSFELVNNGLLPQSYARRGHTQEKAAGKGAVPEVWSHRWAFLFKEAPVCKNLFDGCEDVCATYSSSCLCSERIIHYPYSRTKVFLGITAVQSCAWYQDAHSRCWHLQSQKVCLCASTFVSITWRIA